MLQDLLINKENINENLLLDRFVLMTSPTGRLASSDTGKSGDFTYRNLFNTNGYYLGKCNNKIIGLAGDGNGNKIAVSTDGVNFSINTLNLPTGNIAYSIEYFNNSYILFLGNEVYSSIDLVNWTKISTISFNVISSFSKDGLIIVGGSAGELATSTDGINWTTRQANVFSNAIKKISFVNDHFILLAGGGNIATSYNGTTWTRLTTSPFSGYEVNSITYVDGLYMACGSSRKLYKSPNLISWTTMNSNFPTSSSINDVAYGLTKTGVGRFVIVGSNGYLAYTENLGNNWIYGQVAAANALTIEKIIFV